MSDVKRVNLTEDYAYAQLRERQLLLTHEADKLILDHTNTLAEMLQFIVAQTRHTLNARRVGILFRYADGLRMEISSDPADVGRFLPIDRSISVLVPSSDTPGLVNDLPNDPLLREGYIRRAEMGPVSSAPRLSVLAAEITLDGQPIGVINVEATSGDRYEQQHLDFVNAVARQISVAITHAALFDEDKFRTVTDRLLMEATAGASDVVMRQVLDHIVSALRSLAFVKPDAADILFADPRDGDRLVVAYSTNTADVGVWVDIGTSVCGEAFRHGRTVLLQRNQSGPLLICGVSVLAPAL